MGIFSPINITSGARGCNSSSSFASVCFICYDLVNLGLSMFVFLSCLHLPSLCIISRRRCLRWKTLKLYFFPSPGYIYSPIYRSSERIPLPAVYR